MSPQLTQSVIARAAKYVLFGALAGCLVCIITLMIAAGSDNEDVLGRVFGSAGFICLGTGGTAALVLNAVTCGKIYPTFRVSFRLFGVGFGRTVQAEEVQRARSPWKYWILWSIAVLICLGFVGIGVLIFLYSE